MHCNIAKYVAKEPSGELLTIKDSNGEPSKTTYESVAKEPCGERPSGEAPKPHYEVVAKESSG